MIQFYSFELQDELILNLFDQKTNGTFLDVACSHPISGSNTYTLEKQFNWSGLGFDLYDVNALYPSCQWDIHRTSPFVQVDVTTDNFSNFLKNNIPAGTIIDYVSLDIDGMDTITALKKIIEAGIKFKSVTYEHEYYIFGDKYRDMSRKILEDLGFVNLFSDVKLLTANEFGTPHRINDTEYFEDWWIHPDYFDPKLLEIKSSGIYYDECVDILKKFKNANYQSTHPCSRAHPEEYSFYVPPYDEHYMKPVFDLVRSKKLAK
jgi:hypothetical protein